MSHHRIDRQRRDCDRHRRNATDAVMGRDTARAEVVRSGGRGAGYPPVGFAVARARALRFRLAAQTRGEADSPVATATPPWQRGSGHGRTSRTVSHQAGCGRNQSLASSGAAMAGAPASGRHADGRRSHSNVPGRNAGGAKSAIPLCYPSNAGMTLANQSPANSVRFTKPVPTCRFPKLVKYFPSEESRN